MYKLKNNLLCPSLCFIVLVVTLSCSQQVNSASILDDLKSASNSLAGTVSNICLSSDGCNKEFFNLKNYCCTGQCCNYINYVFQQSDNTKTIWENFVYTCENPRAINIIIFIVFVLVFCSVLSILMSIVGYFCCGCSRICCCCGTRKYSIVNH